MDQLAAVIGLGRILRDDAPVDELLYAASAMLARDLAFRTIAIHRRSAGDGEFVLAAVHGGHRHLRGAATSYSDWAPILGRSAGDGAVFVPGAGDGGTAGAWGPGDVVAAPLPSRSGDLLGIVTLDDPVDGRRPGPDALHALAGMATVLAFALETATAGALQRVSGGAFERLLAISAHVREAPDPLQTLHGVCDAVVGALGFAHAEIALLRDETLETVAGDTTQLDGLSTEAARRDGALVLDLRDRHGALAGVLRATAADGSAPSPELLQLLRMFANQAAAALDLVAHEVVLDSEATKAAMLASSLDAVIVMDHEGRVREYNTAAERTFGYRRDEVIGQELGELFVPEELRDRHREGVARQVAGKGGSMVGKRVTTPALRKNGERFPAEIAITRIERDGPPLFTAYMRDISDRVAAEEALRAERDRATHLVSHDDLTGLPNRRLASAKLEEASAFARHTGATVAALLVDLDGFRVVNDSLGHAAGDELLRKLAQRLEGAARGNRTAARVGGDQFMIVVPDAGAADGGAEGVARDVQTALGDPFDVDGIELHAAATIGIALAPGGMLDAGELLKRADIAVARAKSLADAVGTFDTEGDQRRTLTLTTALRRAIERDEFELHYQPINRPADGTIAGLEALLRWYPGGGDPVPPSEFIPLAEASGLIERIGEWVMHAACRQSALWRANGFAPPIVSVNVSPRQFRRADVPALVAGELELNRLAPGTLRVEVTESALQYGARRIEDELGRLRDLGVSLAVDDFGSDYSSLARLRELPFDLLKIDRAFVTTVPDDLHACNLLEAIMGLARALDMPTCVEGVEDDSQLDFVRHAGADLVQGFVYARPLPADRVAALLPLAETPSREPAQHADAA